MEAEDGRVSQSPARQCRLSVVGRRAAPALRQFLEFAPEDVVHPQLPRDFVGDVTKAGTAGIQIHFLEDQKVGLLRC